MDLSELTKPRKGRLERRSRAAMKALREAIKRLSSEGRSRKLIAIELGCAASIVTRVLGPLRHYRGRFHR